MTTMRPFNLALALAAALALPLEHHAQMGSLDLSFNSTGVVVQPVNTGDNAQKVLVQPDQKILVVGMSFDASFQSQAHVFRYLPDGSPDLGFATDGVFTFSQDFEANLYSAVLTSENKIVLVGSTTDYQTYRIVLIRLNADGSLDSDFGNGGIVLQSVTEAPAFGEDMGFDLVLDADGNILVCGSSFSADYVSRPVVVRFTPDGALDASFGNGGVATIPVGEYACDFKGIAVQPDGRIVAVGTYGNGLLWWVLLVARFEADGSLDNTFGTNGVVKQNYGGVDDEAEDLALLPDGSILVAGFTVTQDYNFSALLMKFTPDGSLDASFGENGAVEEDLDDYDYAAQVKVLADGSIAMAGTSGDGPPGAFDMAVWKYNGDGSRQITFGNNGIAQPVIPGYSAMIYGMDVQADGHIVVCGQARTPSNQNFFMAARLVNDLSNGIVDAPMVSGTRLFPNPCVSGERVTLQTGAPVRNEAVLLVRAADGRLINQWSAAQHRIANDGVVLQLPVGLAPGAYTVSLEQGTERHVASLLIP